MMIQCPACRFENLPGSDVCQECQCDLTAAEARHLDAMEKRLRDDPLRDLLGGKPLVANVDDTIESVVNKMAAGSHNCALVVKDGELVGIFTERDLIRKAAHNYASQAARPIRDAMSPDPVALTPDDSVAFALNKMSVGGYRHVPITDENNHPVAVISIKDVLTHLVTNLPEVFRPSTARG